jgi:Domain of unknown function (DUF4926)
VAVSAWGEGVPSRGPGVTGIITVRDHGDPPFALLQVVALRHAHPERGLAEDQEGTVVEIIEHPEWAHVVDFTGASGHDLCLAPFTAEQLYAVPVAR